MTDIYEIRLQGHFDDCWQGWFDGLTISHHANGTTCLTGEVIDQAALHGLLRRVRDTGMKLIAITCITCVTILPDTLKGA